jgi:hypothetical protein
VRREAEFEWFLDGKFVRTPDEGAVFAPPNKP